MKQLGRILMLLLPVAAMAAEPDTAFERPGALLLNVTESDLNQIVRGSFHSKGGPNFEGTKRKSTATVSGLTYHATLSEPVVKLNDNGKAELTFDVREGNLHIARLERKIAGRSASCEDTGVFVDPSRPLEVMMALDFRIEHGDLQFFPESVSVSDAEHRLNLVPFSRCTNALLPRWLLWWIGKPTLKKYLSEIDDMLLERARKSATRAEGRRAVLRKRWDIGDGAEVHVFPTALDTSRGSLFVSMTASSESAAPEPGVAQVSLEFPADRTYVAVSQPFLNDLARAAVSRMKEERVRPTGNLRKLLRSSSVYALIPGLRGLDPNTPLLYSVGLRTPPRVEVTTSPGGDAMLRFQVSDLELRLFKGEHHGATPLGTLAVKSGRVAVAPYRSVIGGTSFRVVENEWMVSSKGIRVDDALVAATLQEVTFGRIFETSYRPLATDNWRIGGARFAPVAFDAIGDYLVIELGEPTDYAARSAEAPMQTSTLRGSH